ncbi:MAG: hypothetical protein DCC75_05650, partial [Proteobacteria bacterium]
MSPNDQALIRIALLSALALVVFIRCRPALHGKIARSTKALLCLTFLGSLWSFPNFGRFHYPHYDYVHYWDAYHYYLGSKYLPEVGYSGLYQASLLAGGELGCLPEITHLRDLDNYQPLPVTKINQNEIRSKFSPARWLDFKADFSLFCGAINQWPMLFLDHGYNETPFRAALTSRLFNAVTLNSLNLRLLSFLDYGLILIAAALTAWAFGLDAALLGVSFLLLNFLARFNFIGGSLLRWDWICALLAALAFYKKGFPKVSGALLAYSCAARVFPLLFIFPCFLKLAFFKGGADSDRQLRQSLSSFAVATLAFMLAARASFAPTILEDYLQRMQGHSSHSFVNQIGLQSTLRFSMADWERDQYGQVYIEQKEIERVSSYDTISKAAGLILSILAMLMAAMLTPLSGMLLSASAVYWLLMPSGYYYSFLALYFLLPGQGQNSNLVSCISQIFLCITMICGYLFELQGQEALVIHYKIGLQLGIFFMLQMVLQAANRVELKTANA